ncbi:putative Elongin-A [Sclerotinia borealis F-4128]|uniref:Putative Elongin-A n=1 Tax=Sclerotinia borealis (strain F-4128) TaxID=1432307 RepID=W9CIX9_SCLBF|nr:putative Elongin-A [Sclerotinia borealis F-4128]
MGELGAPSLFSTAKAQCIKAAPSLTDIGDFEYMQIRDILKAVKKPEQLHIIEMNSPQIKGEDAELWQAFIAREFPNWRTKNYIPKNPNKWYEVYLKYKSEREVEILRDRENLKNSMNALAQHKQNHLSKFVELRALPKIPREYGMRPNNGGVPLTKGRGLQKSAPNSLTWSGGSRTKMTDGASVLTRARREAKEITQRSKLVTPTSMLSGRLGQVGRAPAGMAQEYKIANQPALKVLARHKTTSRLSGGTSGLSLEDREKKLRAAMVSKKPDPSAPKETYVGSSDDETYGNDADDLFDEPEEARSVPRATRPPPPSRKIIKPVAPSSRLRSSSPPNKPISKPSGVISGIVNNSKSSFSPASSRTSSAPPSRAATPKPMMPARRRPAEVDVFNRGPKKPRR